MWRFVELLGRLTPTLPKFFPSDSALGEEKVMPTLLSIPTGNSYHVICLHKVLHDQTLEHSPR